MYWRGRPDTEQTIVSFSVETGELHGFGTWKIRSDLKRPGRADETVIDIPFFGVDHKFHGERDVAGHSLAGRLYATVEAIARRHPKATPEMLVHLVCDTRNGRGFAFWQSQGFKMDERLTFPTVSYWRMFRSL
jgi:hypothetical protein